jgi:enoyl-CoA hydratase
MEYQFLEVADDNGLLKVLINRPAKRNALSQGVLAELRRCFEQAAQRDDLCAAVLRGAGERCFAAGGDLQEFDGMRTREQAERIGIDSCAALDAIRHFPVPVVALLNGDALGGGGELAVACDIRIAAPHARIAFVQGTLNIAPAWGGGADLMRLVGPAQALRLLCRADLVGVEEALALGLIQGHCPPAQDFDVYCEEFLKPFRERRPQVTRAFKALARAEREGLAPAPLRKLENALLVETWCHADHWEAHDRALARISR